MFRFECPVQRFQCSIAKGPGLLQSPDVHEGVMSARIHYEDVVVRALAEKLNHHGGRVVHVHQPDFVVAAQTARCYTGSRGFPARPTRAQGRRSTFSGSEGGTSATDSSATGPPERSTIRTSAPPESA